ncbi:MAG: hypothetical protein VKP70_10305 [Cyanobacteriota bacterium]|nr:hypothetical protein [Cyanobacteriota bacterium]
MGRPLLSLLGLTTATLMGWPAGSLLVVGSVAAATDGPATLLARGGGGRGGGHGHARTGFHGGGNFPRGNNRPSGGFSSGDRLNRVGQPSISRPVRRPDGGVNFKDRQGTIGERVGDRSLQLDRGNRALTVDGGNRSISVDRDWTREVNLGDIHLNPGWARPGWGVARPWNWGWYGGWRTPPWGWWAARAAAWGIGTLATTAIINHAVNDAVSNDVNYIVVPNTSYELRFGTVQPYGNAMVNFVVTANGTSYQLTADCNAGTINERPPNSSQEAELLNAACQVAYGQAS